MTSLKEENRFELSSQRPELVAEILAPWEKAKVEELTRKAIHRLSHLQAAGLFSECNYTSVWGEYSHHVQNGDFSDFSDLLDDMAADACKAVADTVPPHELHLFDQLAAAFAEENDMSGFDYLFVQLKDAVSTRASARDLERYSDEYRWYDNL